MEKIYSKVQPDLLLHVVFRSIDFDEDRKEIIPAEQFIQCAGMILKKGKTFRPHKHIVSLSMLTNKIAQESWHVIKGKVKCIFYDIDDKIIAESILEKGDTSFTLRGGHNYLVLSKKAKILEHKTGPYLGQAFDKEFI